MHGIFYLAGAAMTLIGFGIFRQAPAITQEIAGILLVGFGVVTVALGGVIAIAGQMRDELRRMNRAAGLPDEPARTRKGNLAAFDKAWTKPK